MDGVNHDEVLRLALDRWKHCYEYESENRERAREDLWFADGDQWPEKIKKDRESRGQPCLTVNRVPSFVRQVVNDIRQIRPAIKVRPVDSQSDPETAEIINGMIRAIEADSSAEAAYDWAADYAVRAGWGYWRIITEYESDESFDQVIRIERVRNPFSVYIDPAAQHQDGHDMRYAFVVDKIPRSEFDKKYPNATGEWETHDADREWWWTEEHVRIAEYWVIEEKPATISLIVDPATGQEMVLEGEIEGAILTRETIKKTVTSYLLTGNQILEENAYPGKYIPIVRVIGREIDIEGEVRLKGMVRDLRDPQRQYNYFRSASTERAALYAKAPYIGPKGAFKSPKWAQANKRNHAYLEWDTEAVMKAGGVAPTRERPPEVSTAFVAETQAAAEELKAVSGIYNPGLGDRSNEVAGVAIDSRKTESDVSNFDFVDNLGKAITYSGKILVDLIPKIYTGARAIRILHPDGSDENVMLNTPYVDEETQKSRDFQLTAGRYDVSVDIGPSYTTQRKEAAESMLEVLRIYPEAGQVIGDLIAKNMDWPEADEMAKRLKAILPASIAEGENPQLQMIMQQKDQEVQILQEQMGQMGQLIQQLQTALQDKDREMTIKEGDLLNKIQKTINDHIEGMTKLEMDAGKDLGPQGQYQ